MKKILEQIHEIQNFLQIDKKVTLIGIAGPSGAGKSSVTKLIEAQNPDILRINLDNYFKDVKKFPKVFGLPNWDLPTNLDFNLLYDNLKNLKAGVNSRVPLFNKATLERKYNVIKPKKIIIIEGFLLFFNKKINSLLDIKIYIDISDILQLERRLKRQTIGGEEYIKGVVIPNYKIYGVPTKRHADIILDGNIPLEELKLEILKHCFNLIGNNKF